MKISMKNQWSEESTTHVLYNKSQSQDNLSNASIPFPNTYSGQFQ